MAVSHLHVDCQSIAAPSVATLSRNSLWRGTAALDDDALRALDAASGDGFLAQMETARKKEEESIRRKVTTHHQLWHYDTHTEPHIADQARRRSRGSVAPAADADAAEYEIILNTGTLRDRMRWQMRNQQRSVSWRPLWRLPGHF